MFWPYGFLTAIKTKVSVQLFMLLFAFASANLHHIIKYMKGSGPIGPSELPFRCFENKTKSFLGKSVRVGLGPLVFLTGQTCWCWQASVTNISMQKPVLSMDFAIVWVQLYSILTKDLKKKKQEHYPELIQAENCLVMEHEMLTKVTFLWRQRLYWHCWVSSSLNT